MLVKFNKKGYKMIKKVFLILSLTVFVFSAKLGEFAPKGDRKEIIVNKVDVAKKKLHTLLKKVIKQKNIDLCNKEIKKVFTKFNKQYENDGIFFERVSRKPRSKKTHYKKADYGIVGGKKEVIVEKYFEYTKLKNGKYPKNFILKLRNKKGLDYFMVYEPIFAKKECLECHGKKIKRKLFQTIKKLYPKDKSMGFKNGDLMGFLVARVSPLAYKIKK
jgi:hypothetical protein